MKTEFASLMGRASISALNAIVFLSGFFPFNNPITPVVAFISKGIPNLLQLLLDIFRSFKFLVAQFRVGV
jgi:hypothetical protein